MKIQSKLMLYIGGTAALVTLVAFSLGSFKLHSILSQISEQNAKLNFEYMAYNAESVTALETSLVNMAFGRAAASLRHTAAVGSGIPQIQGSLKETLRTSEFFDSAVLILRKQAKAADGDKAEVQFSFFKREGNTVNENKSLLEKGFEKPEFLGFVSTNPSLVEIEDQDVKTLNAPLLFAMSLKPVDGYDSIIIAYPVNEEFLLKSVRPKFKGVCSTLDEQAVFAIGSADGEIHLYASPDKNMKLPKDIFSLIPGSLPDIPSKNPQAIFRPSKLTLSFRSGNFAELAPKGETVPWLVGSTPLQVDLQNAKAKLIKLFPYPKQYSETDITRSARANIDDLMVTACFIALFGLLLFLPPLFIIAKGISAPLSNAVAFSNVLAKGEFPPNTLKMSGPTEIQELGRSLNYMRDRLSNTISKLKKSHEREMMARKDAEAANHLKSDFLANMSLELRNPLNSIMGFSTLILKDTEKGLYDESLKSKLKTILESAESLNSLVSTLLDLSKLDTANVELRPTEFETATLMRELVEAAIQPASEHGITIENHFSPDAPVSIYTDRELLSHTLSLLSTSLIRSNPGAGRISFGCFTSGNKVVFRVKDAKEHRASSNSLAEIYLRYSLSQTEIMPTLAGTTLLNLTIAKNQAHILGADFEVESGAENDDFNSSFTLSFLKSELIASATGETSSVHMATNWSSSSHITQTDSFPAFKRSHRSKETPIHVLMAEDNEANRLLVELMLKESNCDLECVADGDSCLKSLSAKKFDILLLDLHMPRLDGYSVLSRIRQDRSLDAMPVIVLTAYLEEGDKEKLIQMGASKCILKPINIDELVNAIRVFTS